MPAIPVRSSIAARAVSSAALPQDSRLLDARQLGRALATATARLVARIAPQRLGLLRPRANEQNVPGAIPTFYEGINAGPSPGAVVGIVLGSVAGFLLIMWLLIILSQGSAFIRTTSFQEEDDYVVRRRTHSTARSHRSRRTEMRSRSPRRDRVIRQERIVRDRTVPTGGGGVEIVPPLREPSRIVTERIIVDEPERRVEGDDIVEVIEEHSSIDPTPRRKSRRGSGYRDSRSHY